MEQLMFHQNQPNGDFEVHEEPHERRSVHATSLRGRFCSFMCGSDRTKDACAGWWVLAMMTGYSVFALFVCLSCMNDERCNALAAAILLFIGLLIVACTALGCFRNGSAEGEPGCLRCCDCMTSAPGSILEEVRTPDSVSIMLETHRSLPAPPPPAPKEPPMPRMETIEEMRPRFTIDAPDV